MTPQPTTPAKAPEQSQKAPEQPQNGAPVNPLTAAGDALLKIADDLQREKRDLLERIGANRDTLRNLAKQNALTQAQVSRVGVLYPERKAKDENAS